MSHSSIVKVNNPMAVSRVSERGNDEVMNIDSRLNAQDNALAAVASSGEIARVQAQLVAAKRFPRDEVQSVDRILNAFSRPSLAEAGLYQYQRGGSDILGLSIRAAEAMAQAWGNIDFGFKEIESRNGESTVEAYAWDLETNTRRAISFRVPHYRDTKAGRKLLTDARDVYECVANNSSRRVRACILAVIPKDVQDAAQEQINATLNAKVDISPERIAKMVKAFAEIGVSKDNLEAFIQRRIDSIQPAQMLRLMRIFNGIRDGISNVSDWFDIESEANNSQKTLAGSAKGEKKTLAKLAQRNAEAKVAENKQTDNNNDENNTSEKAEDEVSSRQAETEHVAVAESSLPTGNETVPVNDKGLVLMLDKALGNTPVGLDDVYKWASATGEDVVAIAKKYLADVKPLVNTILDWQDNQ